MIDILTNFKDCKKIINESAIFLKNDYFESTLLFDPLFLVSVTNFDDTISYPVENFEIIGNKLIYKGKDIIHLTNNEYEGLEGDPFDLSEMKRFRIKKPYYSESFMQKKQLNVTYVPKFTCDYFEIFENDRLLNIKNKIKNKENIKIVVYGDSICRGMTSSGYMNRYPFQPPWYDLIKMGLEDKYNINVEMINNSESGMDALWGVNHMKERMPLGADLYIIGFGMNDGTGGVSEDFYISNIKQMIDYIGDKDIILMSTIIPNPDAELTDGSKFLNKQENYYSYLKKLENDKIAVANFTQMHKNMLQRKKYCDLSGNNINHPNDFLSRCLAMGILRMLKVKGN